MRRLIPGHNLSKEEINLIPEAIFWLIVARLKVSFVPSARWIEYFGRTGIKGQSSVFPNAAELKIHEIPIVVRGLSLRMPWQSTCMVESLATHYMLQKRKVPHKIHFGVKKDAKNKLEAHAWLSVGDLVIIGLENLDEFIELRPIT